MKSDLFKSSIVAILQVCATLKNFYFALYKNVNCFNIFNVGRVFQEFALPICSQKFSNRQNLKHFELIHICSAE